MNQLRKMQIKGVVSLIFQITLLKEEISVPTLEVKREVEHLLREFEDLFAKPKSLPPHRILDRKIHLLPNFVPVNIRIYKHPHFQKVEIEKQVA